MELNWRLLLVGGLVYLVTFAVSLIAVAVVLVSIPPTYFLHRSVRKLPIDQHPLVRLLLQIIKNLIGLSLVVAGIMLSLPGIPGQGILTCLIGILLMDFPGKRRLARKIVGQPRIRAAIDRLRRRFGRPPLQLPNDGRSEFTRSAGR
jgi:hypothetical protein